MESCQTEEKPVVLSHQMSLEGSLMTDNLPVTLEFGGGAELLFNNKKEHDITLNVTTKWTIRELLDWMKKNLIAERHELFFQGDSVRPGILVLVNETDWELMVNNTILPIFVVNCNKTNSVVYNKTCRSLFQGLHK